MIFDRGDILNISLTPSGTAGSTGAFFFLLTAPPNLVENLYKGNKEIVTIVNKKIVKTDYGIAHKIYEVLYNGVVIDLDLSELECERIEE
jgi:hypothetical protein